jgi:hypothetical protein
VQENDDVILIYCKSENQPADLFIKSLPVNMLELLRQKIGISVFKARRSVEDCFRTTKLTSCYISSL